MPFLHVCIRHMAEPAWRFPALLVRLVPCPSTSRVKNILFPPSPPKSSPPHRVTGTGPQTYSTSFPSLHLLIPHCHPLGPVRTSLTRRQHSSWRTSLYRPSNLAHAIRTIPRLSNGHAHNDRRALGKWKSTRRSGSNKLMHVLQNAFESNWSRPDSTNMSPRAKTKPE